MLQKLCRGCLHAVVLGKNIFFVHFKLLFSYFLHCERVSQSVFQSLYIDIRRYFKSLYHNTQVKRPLEQDLNQMFRQNTFYNLRDGTLKNLSFPFFSVQRAVIWYRTSRGYQSEEIRNRIHIFVYSRVTFFIHTKLIPKP